GLLGGRGDRGEGRVPGVERLAGGEPRCGAPGGQGSSVPAGGLLREQGPEHLEGFPALGLGGCYDVGGVSADVRQAQAPQQRLQVLGQRWRGRHAGGRDGAVSRRGGHRITSVSLAPVTDGCWPRAAQAEVPWVRDRSSPARWT